MKQSMQKAMKQKSYSKYKERRWRKFKDQLDHVKSATDPRYLVESLGIQVERETSKELRGACKVHGGDNKTSFRFNKETKTWVCFSHKCHEIHGNDMIGLIRAMTGEDFMGAVNYLKDLIGYVDENIDYEEFRRKKEIDNFTAAYADNRHKPARVNEEHLMRSLILRTNFFRLQGFSESTLNHFEVAGGWKDKNDCIREIIPIRDERGALLAYSLRDTRENADYDYKYILTPGFDKQTCLYNLHNAAEYCANMPLIVVEGFKSVWRLYEYGIENVVAVMGSEITDGQQLKLCSFAMKGIVVFFDNDAAGVTGTSKALENLSDKMDVRPVYIQERDEDGKGLDPADLPKELVYEYLDTYF
jgi:DNA primase